MALSWKTFDKQQVTIILKKYGVRSSKCFCAAKKIKPICISYDSSSSIYKIIPAEGYFVIPKQELDEPWTHHYTTKRNGCYVDALTGVDGKAEHTYFSSCWEYSEDAYILKRVEDA